MPIKGWDGILFYCLGEKLPARVTKVPAAILNPEHCVILFYFSISPTFHSSLFPLSLHFPPSFLQGFPLLSPSPLPQHNPTTPKNTGQKYQNLMNFKPRKNLSHLTLSLPELSVLETLRWFQLLSPCMKSYGVTIQMKPLQQYFHMVLFIFKYPTK